MHRAAFEGHLDIVKYLIEECHCNPEEKDNNGETALDLAYKCEYSGIADYLNARNAGE